MQLDENWMEERLLEIEDLNLRKEAKVLLNTVMQPIFGEIQQAYLDLEERLKTERNHAETYEIITTIKPRTEVDLTNGLLFPMCEADMKERCVSAEELLKGLNAEGYGLFQVYVKDTYDKVWELLNDKQYFAVEIHTEYGCYHGRAKLEKSDKYELIIQQLYEVFVMNGIEWKTVNAPHLQKLLQVVLIEADCPADEEIISVKVDFREYTDMFLYDYIPLWNISETYVETSVYPVLKDDGVYYEHTIHGSALKENCQYLIQGEKPVFSMNYEEKSKDILICCKERKPVNWHLWQIAVIEKEKLEAGEWMRNGNKRNRPHVRTKAEAIRFAAGLPSNEYIILNDISTEYNESTKEIRTYLLDIFLTGNMKRKQEFPKLYLECVVKDKNSYLNQDMLSFLVARIQLLYPEYECVACAAADK